MNQLLRHKQTFKKHVDDVDGVAIRVSCQRFPMIEIVKQ
jgi:hypothetical protein